jgi:uncharacterized membrane protein
MMNPFHLHLLFNHLPIVGIYLSILVIFSGIILKNQTVKNVALCLIVISGIGAFVAHVTGEGAEESSELRNDFSHDLIEKHEHASQPFFQIMLALTLLSAVALFFNLKKKNWSNYLIILIAIISIAAAYFAQQAGTSGGEIRHPEISDGSATAIPSNAEDSH